MRHPHARKYDIFDYQERGPRVSHFHGENGASLCERTVFVMLLGAKDDVHNLVKLRDWVLRAVVRHPDLTDKPEDGAP